MTRLPKISVIEKIYSSHEPLNQKNPLLKDRSFSLPAIAFAGRSNVGKSSLINSLLRRKRFAPTSSTPGKTRAVTLYKINNKWIFMDLPGYGYAKVPLKMREEWKRLVESYLLNFPCIRGAVLILDSRHPPFSSDAMLFEWLRFNRIPVIIAQTKIDKIPRSIRKESVDTVFKEFCIEQGNVNIIQCSSKSGEGMPDLWKVLSIHGIDY